MKTYKKLKEELLIENMFDTIKQNIENIFKDFSFKMTEKEVEDQFYDTKFGLQKTLKLSRQDIIDVFDNLLSNNSIIKKNNIFIYKK